MEDVFVINAEGARLSVPGSRELGQAGILVFFPDEDTEPGVARGVQLQEGVYLWACP